MPVHMGCHITEAGEIYFIWRTKFAQNRFDSKNYSHQIVTVNITQIAHFANMLLPDNPAITGVVRIIYQHDPAQWRLP